MPLPGGGGSTTVDGGGGGGLDSMLQFGAFQWKFCLIFWVANLFAESAWYSAVSASLQPDARQLAQANRLANIIGNAAGGYGRRVLLGSGARAGSLMVYCAFTRLARGRTSDSTSGIWAGELRRAGGLGRMGAASCTGDFGYHAAHSPLSRHACVCSFAHLRAACPPRWSPTDRETSATSR